MIRGLNEGTEVAVCLVGIWFALPIVHIARIDAQTCEEVNNVHEQLLRRVWDLGNDSYFLAVCVTVEKEFRGVFQVLGGDKIRIVLVHPVEGGLTLRCHELVKDLMW